MKLLMRLYTLSLFACLASVSSIANAQSELSKFENAPSLEQLGSSFAELLNQRDSDSLTQLIDVNVMSHRINQMFDKKDFKILPSQLSDGLKRGFFNNVYNTMSQTNGKAYYRRMIKVGGQYRALLLLDYGDNGLNFMELIAHPSSKKVVDIYVHTSGEKITDTMTKTMGLMMADSSNVFKRLLDISDVDQSILRRFQQVGELNRQGKQHEVYAVLDGLPKKIKDTRLIRSLLTMYSQYQSEAVYEKELRELDRLHGDEPELFLLLMDHYFTTGQYQRAVEGLNRLNKRFGDDGMVNYLISAAQFSDNRFNDAKKSIEKAISQEPNRSDYYWFKSDILNGLKSFDAVVAMFNQIESKFDESPDLDFLKTQAEWTDFFASSQYKRYINR